MDSYIFDFEEDNIDTLVVISIDEYQNINIINEHPFRMIPIGNLNFQHYVASGYNLDDLEIFCV